MHRARARGMPGGHRSRRRRELRRFRRRCAAAGDPPVHVPGGGRRGGDPPQIHPHRELGRRTGRAAGARERVARRCRRARPVPAFHAQGDSRAAARHCADPGRARSGSEIAGSGVRAGRLAAVQARQGRAHRGLRYQLSRRPRGQLFHRTDLPYSGARRDRERVPLPRSGDHRRTRCSSPFPNPARPRTLWRPCATPARRLICRRSPSATWPKARWCASRSWCC